MCLSVYPLKGMEQVSVSGYYEWRHLWTTMCKQCAPLTVLPDIYTAKGGRAKSIFKGLTCSIKTISWSSYVKNSHAHAGGHGLDPWSRRIPRTSGQLSLCPTACAPQQEKPSEWEACAPQLESRPCSPELERACEQQQTPSTVKNTQTNE